MLSALQGVPQTWAKHKYDVGSNCEPVVITHKTTYRPCKKQGPLEQEAIDSIIPEFESLLQASDSSPCCTAIF